MADSGSHDEQVQTIWQDFMMRGVERKELRYRPFFRAMPSSRRCRFCFAPFEGLGAPLVRILFDKEPSNLNPHLCNACESFAREHQGGAELELSLLFADVRGSTAIAEKLSPAEFGRLINRFYTTVTEILIRSDALIDKVIGDQAAGIYVPGFAGPHHAHRAIEAAREIHAATGHGDSNGPWIPLGIGVHTGTAFVGSVGHKDGTTDITVLGDTANTAARLSTVAQPGEILVSEPAYQNADFPLEGAERKELTLKGKSEQVAVYSWIPVRS